MFLEAEMRGIVEAENLSATLDSLSPMHAETEGNEPNPSVQLCKFKSKKSGRKIATEIQHETKLKCGNVQLRRNAAWSLTRRA